MNWRLLPVRNGSHAGINHYLNNLPVLGACDHVLNVYDGSEVAGGLCI